LNSASPITNIYRRVKLDHNEKERLVASELGGGVVASIRACHQEDLQELFDPNLSITALPNSKLMFIIDIFEIAAANANLYL
jgi:hypothetical protein